MTNSIAAKKIENVRFIRYAFLVIPSTLLFMATLGFTKAATANSFSQTEQRGAHGASHIVNKAKPNAPAVQSNPVKETQKERVNETRQFPILVQQGTHGASRILSKKGVGGPQGHREYRGFPKLEFNGSHGASRIVND